MLSTSIADSDPSKSIDVDVWFERRDRGLGLYVTVTSQYSLAHLAGSLIPQTRL